MRLVCLLYTLTLPALASAQVVDWCKYPTHAPKAAKAASPLALAAVGEAEPNDTPASAQVVSLADPDVDLSGSISPNSDVDYYRVSVQKGDILGVAALGGGAPDTILRVTDLAGNSLLENDDHGNIAAIYPPNSPLPGGASTRDSALSWIAPATGDYLLRVTSWNGGSSGPYTLQIRHRNGGMHAEDAPAQQTLFVDFDGATGIDAPALFGSGNSNATLSGLGSFLGGWGLGPADESAVIDAIMFTIEENLDDLRTAALNGDRDSDGIDGHMDVLLLNSRDHADPFGQPNVSRLIVGGSIAELGISTLGIAQHIDPGNFGHEDTAVVLLDLLSAPANDPNSVNGIPRAVGTTIIDAIGITVGNITTHEAGHYLGNWHTDNGNGQRSIMDRGGAGLAVHIAGVGVDGVLGTGDDEDIDFVSDALEDAEGVAVGDEDTDLLTAFGLSTGAQNASCSVDADCDDGDPCNGAETCDAGNLCQAGVALNCDDADACTDDSCTPGVGCANAVVTCDDGDSCTADACDSQLGCVAQAIAPCCGNGSCEAGEDCSSCANDCFSASGGTCGDGNCDPGEDCQSCASDCRCTGGGSCRKSCCGDGVCKSENAGNCPIDCDPGYLPPAASCCGDGTCEAGEDTGNCGIDCDVSCANDGECADGDLCNGVETCGAGGSCELGTPVDCDDADACTDDSCDAQTGGCTNAPVSCDDGDACTVDSCNAATGCSNVAPACQNGDGCCPSGCDSGNDSDCPSCGGRGAACGSGADCCSGNCKRNGTCR